MKREDIEKVKVENAERIANIAYSGGGHIGQDDLEAAFENGADWRINSVWHDAKDVPQPFRAFVILHDTENDFMMLTQHSITCDSDYNVIYQENDNMIAWAYIEDLIPNTEE